MRSKRSHLTLSEALFSERLGLIMFLSKAFMQDSVAWIMSRVVSSIGDILISHQGTSMFLFDRSWTTSAQGAIASNVKRKSPRRYG